jgi:hypothetical protein
LWLAIGTCIALAAALAAWGVQQMRLDDARSSLDEARSTVIAQNREIAALQVRLDHMADRMATQGSQMQDRVAQLRARADALRGDLAEARASLADARAVLGPPIADGRYTAELRMVGGNQVPPMVAFDRVHIFTGEKAVEAALADGVDPADVPEDPEYYLYVRNENPTWRVVPVAPDVGVVLQSWRFQKEGGYHPVEVTLGQFHRIYNGSAEWNHHFRWQRYALRIGDGEVTAIEELNLSP